MTKPVSAQRQPDQNPKALIRARALASGFDAVGFARPGAVAKAGARLRAFVAAGQHGDMGWLADTLDRRADPNTLWPEARSIVVLARNYGPDGDPLARNAHTDKGQISVYALGRDYHDVLKKDLRVLARWMHERLGAAVKLFVDTAPVMEKPAAAAAGIGWVGKHTSLVSRDFGSWLFLGEIFTDLDLAPDDPGVDRCGACARCQTICPTRAFPAPYRLDARRCISYLTIEHKGHIPRPFRAAMGNRIYGCDDCLAVCPWNKFARRTTDPVLGPRAALTAPALTKLARLDDPGFRTLFSGSAVKRLGRDRFLRNVMIALGNSGDEAVLDAVQPRLDDPSPLVRAMAVWALGRLVAPGAFAALRARHAPGETDAAVRAEWRAAGAILNRLP